MCWCLGNGSVPWASCEHCHLQGSHLTHRPPACLCPPVRISAPTSPSVVAPPLHPEWATPWTPSRASSPVCEPHPLLTVPTTAALSAGAANTRSHSPGSNSGRVFVRLWRLEVPRAGDRVGVACVTPSEPPLSPTRGVALAAQGGCRGGAELSGTGSGGPGLRRLFQFLDPVTSVTSSILLSGTSRRGTCIPRSSEMPLRRHTSESKLRKKNAGCRQLPGGKGNMFPASHMGSPACDS